MKFFSAIIVCAVLLPLVSAEPILNTTTTTTTSSAARSSDYDTNNECPLVRSKEECDPFDQCGWINGQCIKKILEECGFINNDSACNSNTDCVWIPDDRDTRPNAMGYCAKRTEAVITPPSDDNIVRDNIVRECPLIQTREACDPVDQCDWIYGVCRAMIVEGCGFVSSNSTCESLTDCVWMSDASDTRPNAKGLCAKRTEVADGNCVSGRFVIGSKSSCNSVKGCSWVGGDSNLCTVAPSQLDCQGIKNKNNCKNAGCISKQTKRKKVCLGRWEYTLLSKLKKTDGIEAKRAIEDEFGEDTYNVVLVGRGAKPSKGKDPARIILFHNKKGAIRKTPKFG